MTFHNGPLQEADFIVESHRGFGQDPPSEDEAYTTHHKWEVMQPYSAEMWDLAMSIGTTNDDVLGVMLANAGFTGSSSTAEIFETIGSDGNEYIVKRVQQDAWLFDVYPGDSVTEKARMMNHVYTLYRRFLGDSICPTLFVVATDEDEEEVLHIVQPKIEGRKFSASTLSQTLQLADLQAYFTEMREDAAFLLLPSQVQRSSYDWAVGTDDNLIETPDGTLVIIDW